MKLLATVTIEEKDVEFTVDGLTDKNAHFINATVKAIAKDNGIKLKNKHFDDDRNICSMSGDWYKKGVRIEFCWY